jgi:purine catabolism regulator
MPHQKIIEGSRSNETGFTLRELISLPFMRGTGLLAGERNVYRSITRINVAEAADAMAWAGSGELLVLSGYSGRNGADWLRSYVPELAKRGISAIGLADNCSLGARSAEICEWADKYGMPLLQLPANLELADLPGIVAERMVSQGADLLVELNERLQRMTRLLLEGNGFHAFLDAMETMLGNPVVVVREQDKTWLSQELRGAESVEMWPLLQSLTYRQIGKASNDGYALLPNVCRIYVKPVPAQRGKQASLTVLERNRSLELLDTLSIDRMASLVGLELANVEAVREVEGKYLDHFLQDWLSGKIVSETDWKLRAEVSGCPIPEGTPVCAVLIGLQSADSGERLREMSRRLRLETLRETGELLAASMGEDLALVLPMAQEKPGEKDGEEAFDILLTGLLEKLKGLLGEPEVRLYAGRIAHRSEGLQASWAQAKRARQVAEVCGLTGETVLYDKLGVYSLLYLIPSGEEREQFLNRYALPLQLADRKGGGRLMETLEMFFRCNGNIKLTSERLFAHYNTIVYRLEKIQAILNVSLDDPEDRLQLHLALKLGQITPGGTPG